MISNDGRCPSRIVLNFRIQEPKDDQKASVLTAPPIETCMRTMIGKRSQVQKSK